MGKSVAPKIAIGLVLGAAVLLSQIPLPSPFGGGGSAGGASVSVQYGPYSSLPSVTGQITGNIYKSTDGPYEFIFNSGAWQAFYPKFGAVSPPGANTMSWVNQGTATIDQTGGIAHIAQAAGNGSAHNWSLRTMAIPTPSSPYTVTGVVRMFDSSRVSSANNPVCIAIRDSSSGKFITIQAGFSQVSQVSLFVYEWTNATTFSTSLTSAIWEGFQGGTSGVASLPFDIVLRIQNDGTNVTYYASDDGVHFVQIYQHAKNTFVTPTDVSFGISNYSQPIDMFVYGFTLTQP